MDDCKHKPEDYKPMDELGYISCHGCDLKGELLGDPICKLTTIEKQKFSHMHGSCAINAHIYKRIMNTVVT